jgi:hypothetical protein
MASLSMATSARVQSTAQAGSRTSIPARSALQMGKTMRSSTFVPSNALRASSVSRKSNTPRAGATRVLSVWTFYVASRGHACVHVIVLSPLAIT